MPSMTVWFPRLDAGAQAEEMVRRGGHGLLATGDDGLGIAGLHLPGRPAISRP